MAKRSLWESIRGGIADGYAASQGFRFPGYGGGMYGSAMGDTPWGAFGRLLPGSDIDYQAEAGILWEGSIVAAICAWIGDKLASCPFIVMEGEGKDAKRAAGHQLADLLNEPNEDYSLDVLWEATAISLYCGGNGYWAKVRSGLGANSKLYYIPDFMMEPRWPRDGSEYVSRYEYRDGTSTPVFFERENIIQTRMGLDPLNTRKGLRVFRPGLRHVVNDNSAATWTASLFRNKAVPGLMLSPEFMPADEKQMLTKAQREELAVAVHEGFTGENRGKVLIPSLPMKASTVGFNPAEMSLDAVHNLSEERLCALAKVPPVVIGFGTGLEQSSDRHNMEVAQRQAWVNCILPLMKKLAKQVSRCYRNDYPTLEKGQWLAFDTSQIEALRENDNDLYARLTKAVGGPWLTPNEARTQTGHDKIEGGEELRKSSLPQFDENRRSNESGEPDACQEGERLPHNRKPKPKSAEEMKFAQFAIKDHAYGSTQVNLPPALADKVRKLAATITDDDLAGGGREALPHVTVKYGLDADDSQAVAEALSVCPPARVELGETTFFSGEAGGKDYDVVYVKVRSFGLEAMNAIIARECECVETQSHYVPHVTVAYVKAGKGEQYAGNSVLDGEVFVADTVMFSSRKDEMTPIGLTMYEMAAA